MQGSFTSTLLSTRPKDLNIKNPYEMRDNDAKWHLQFQEDCSEIIEVAETEDDSNVLQQQCPVQLADCKEEEVGFCSLLHLIMRC